MRTSKLGLQVKDIKASELYGKLIKASGESEPLQEAHIARKLFAAEDFYERTLQVKFGETRVFSNPRLRAQSIDPFVKVSDFDETADVEEAAYDYERGLFEEARWAQVRLGHKPVKAITKAFFWYPGTAIGASWNIPLDWPRVDYRKGIVELVPATGAMLQLLSVNAYVLSSIAAGRSIPQSIFIDYTTGLSQALLAAQHQDLIEGVRLRTLLLLFGILVTTRNQGQTGGSLSLDGLSHSRSWGGKYGAYSGEIELAIETEQQIRDNWLDQEQGPLVEFA